MSTKEEGVLIDAERAEVLVCAIEEAIREAQKKGATGADVVGVMAFLIATHVALQPDPKDAFHEFVTVCNHMILESMGMEAFLKAGFLERPKSEEEEEG